MTRFNFSAWAIRHGSLTRYFLVLLLGVGVFSYFKLGQNEDPGFTFRVMVVSARLPGATASQVEQLLTDKIERKLQELPWLDKLRSYSKPGEAMVFVQVRGDTPPKEIPALWYQVRKKIADIAHTLPPETLGPFFNDEFGDTYGALYGVRGEGFSDPERKDAADRARQVLLRVPNVAKVDLFGVQEEVITLEFSHRKLAQMGVSVEQVIAALQAHNALEPAGSLDTASDVVRMRVSGQYQREEDLAQLPLSAPNGARLRLGDFATVKRGLADPPEARVRFNGQPVVAIGVTMARGGDIIALGRDLSAAVEKIQADWPAGLALEQIADQPRVVKRSVNEFLKTLAEAVLIVLAVSFVSLGLHTRPLRVDMRPGLVVALSIPLVLAITFLFMWLLRIDLQKISLGALIIALGLLVDDAIIAVEMMVRKLDEGLDRVSAASYAYTTTAGPMLTGTLITVAGFLPVGFAQSAAGEYTFSIFAVNAIALITSWVVAVWFTPYLGTLLLKEKPGGAAHEVFDTPFYQRLRAMIDACVENRKTVMAVTLAAFLLGMAGFGLIQQQFFPDSNREELNVELWLPEGASYRATDAEARRFEALLARPEIAPDIVNFVTYIGQGSPRFFLPLDQQLNHSNFAQVIVLTRDTAARERVAAKLRASLDADFPGLRGRVNALPAGPPVPYPVQFQVTGPQADTVRRFADEVAAVMRADPDTFGVNDNWNNPIKVMRFEVDQDKARALGVSSQSISRALQTVLSGLPVGQFRQGDKLITVLMRQVPDERAALDRLADVNLPTASGRFVPLAQVVRAELQWEPGIIWRQARQPAITVQSEIHPGVQGPYVTARLDPQLDALRAGLPPGYAITIGGATEESAAAQDSINAIMPAMLVAVFTLLMLQLKSTSRSLMVLLTAPLGLIGAAVMLLVLRAPFGFVAMLGVIALAGMIMRNSVILIDQIEQDIAAGREPWQAIVEAAVRRFRPIMLTAAAAILAMIPLTRSIFWGPMAVAIMGGLLGATVLTVFFLPALYAAWFRVRRACVSHPSRGV